MARTCKSFVPISLLLLMATLMATSAALDSKGVASLAAESEAGSSRDLRHVSQGQPHQGPQFNRMLPSVYSERVVSGVETELLAKGTTLPSRKLQANVGPKFSRKMRSMYSERVVSVVNNQALYKGRRLQAKQGPENRQMLPSVFSTRVVGAINPSGGDTLTLAQGRRLQAKQGPELGRKMPFFFFGKPKALEVVGAVSSVDHEAKGRKLLGAVVAAAGTSVRGLEPQSGPEFARKMPFVFPHTPADSATVVDTLASDGVAAVRGLKGQQGPEFARKMPTTFSGKPKAVVDILSSDRVARGLKAQPGPVFFRKMPSIFSHDVKVAVAADSGDTNLAVGAASKSVDAAVCGRKLFGVSSLVASGGVHVQGRLLPSRNPKQTDTAAGVGGEGAIPSKSASGAVGAVYKGRKLSSVYEYPGVGHAHGRLLPTVKNTGAFVSEIAGGAAASRSASEAVAPGAVVRGRKLSSVSTALIAVPHGVHGRLLPEIKNGGGGVRNFAKEAVATRSASDSAAVGARVG